MSSISKVTWGIRCANLGGHELIEAELLRNLATNRRPIRARHLLHLVSDSDHFMLPRQASASQLQGAWLRCFPTLEQPWTTGGQRHREYKAQEAMFVGAMFWGSAWLHVDLLSYGEVMEPANRAGADALTRSSDPQST